MPTPGNARIAYVALGSNLGDRREILQGALRAMHENDAVDVEKTSSIIETAPVGGPPNQGNYLNAVARIRTTLGPHELLDLLLDLERRFGRRRAQRWGPRTLDLDLLLYEDEVLQTERLTVPHPRMQERRFVLEPLCEVAPDVVHPLLGLTVRELLERLT